MSNAIQKLKEVTSTKYTADELENLPQTTKIFDRPELDFGAHSWLQEGYMITDNCQPFRADCLHVGIPIPSGKTLVKKNGRYEFVDEL